MFINMLDFVPRKGQGMFEGSLRSHGPFNWKVSIMLCSKTQNAFLTEVGKEIEGRECMISGFSQLQLTSRLEFALLPLGLEGFNVLSRLHFNRETGRRSDGT